MWRFCCHLSGHRQAVLSLSQEVRVQTLSTIHMKYSVTMHRYWRWRFSERKKTSPAQPIPTSMAEAGQLLHLHFHEVLVWTTHSILPCRVGMCVSPSRQQIVDAVCDYFSERGSDFQQQVWFCYEKVFFDSVFVLFLTQYQVRNVVTNSPVRNCC